MKVEALFERVALKDAPAKENKSFSLTMTDTARYGADRGVVESIGKEVFDRERNVEQYPHEVKVGDVVYFDKRRCTTIQSPDGNVYLIHYKDIIGKEA